VLFNDYSNCRHDIHSRTHATHSRGPATHSLREIFGSQQYVRPFVPGCPSTVDGDFLTTSQISKFSHLIVFAPIPSRCHWPTVSAKLRGKVAIVDPNYLSLGAPFACFNFATSWSKSLSRNMRKAICWERGGSAGSTGRC
jgi:hypothetical protein